MWIAYFVALFAIVFAFCIGVLVPELERKERLIIIPGMIIASYLCIFALNVNTDYVLNEFKNETTDVIQEEIATITEMPEFYYLEAQINRQIGLSDGTFEIQFYIDNPEGPLYLWKSDRLYEEDAIYLLTMESYGTYDILDDAIAVVWMDMN